MLEALDEAALEHVAANLRSLSSTDARASLRDGHRHHAAAPRALMAIASYALRAL